MTAAEGAAPLMSPAPSESVCRGGPQASKVNAAPKCGEVLAALASPPTMEFAVPATLWPATPSPGLLDAGKAALSPMLMAPAPTSAPGDSSFTLMLSPPGLGCLVPVVESKLPSPALKNAEHAAHAEMKKPVCPADRASPHSKPASARSPQSMPAAVRSPHNQPSSVRTSPAIGAPHARPPPFAHPESLCSPSASPKTPKDFPEDIDGTEKELAAVREKKSTAVENEDFDHAQKLKQRERLLLEHLQKLEASSCSLCHHHVNLPPPSEDTLDRFYMDGRLVCEECRLIFDDVPFVSKYHVCINPLCRRKWKQLTPKVLHVFCPPCKRHLEFGLPVKQCGLETAPLELMYERWHKIFSEIAEAAGYPAPCLKVVKPPPATFEDSEQARDHWRNVLIAFRETFPRPPASEDVRNWNSVHGRRKHYRGIVHRRHRGYCVTVEALEELGADLTPLRRVNSGAREFSLLDWRQELEEDQEVHFIAFPNPSVEERDKVSRIIRLLDVPDEEQEKCPSPTTVPAAATNVPAAATNVPAAAANGSWNTDPATVQTAGSNSKAPAASAVPDQTAPAFADTAFADLMQWSQEQPEPDAPSAAPAARGAAGSNLALPTAVPAGLQNGKAAAGVATAAIAAAAAAAAQQDSMQQSMQLSFEGYQLYGDGGMQRPPGANGQMPPYIPNFAAPPFRPKGGAQAPMMGVAAPGMWMPAMGIPPGIMAAGRGNGRGMPQKPQTPLYIAPFVGGPGRSPMMCPRSPYAAYFDD